MIYPQKNIIIRTFFRIYLPYIIRRNFHKVNFNQITVNENKSVLLLANHYSWWDAFLLYYVFTKLTGKQFFVMVSEENMQQHPFLKYIGSFSVNSKTKDVITSINYAAELLNDPKNLVLIFPQGKLHSNFVDDVQFEKGALKIIDQAQGKFELIYAASFIEHLQHKKPTVNVYLAENTIVENFDALTGSYNQHYLSAKKQQTNIVL